MSSSKSGSAQSRTSSLGSAGSRSSTTPPSSAGKTNSGRARKTATASGSGAKQALPPKPSDRLNPKTVDPVCNHNFYFQKIWVKSVGLFFQICVLAQRECSTFLFF